MTEFMFESYEELSSVLEYTVNRYGYSLPSEFYKIDNIMESFYDGFISVDEASILIDNVGELYSESTVSDIKKKLSELFNSKKEHAKAVCEYNKKHPDNKRRPSINDLVNEGFLKKDTLTKVTAALTAISLVSGQGYSVASDINDVAKELDKEIVAMQDAHEVDMCNFNTTLDELQNKINKRIMDGSKITSPKEEDTEPFVSVSDMRGAVNNIIAARKNSKTAKKKLTNDKSHG